MSLLLTRTALGAYGQFDMRIRAARPTEAQLLTDLAIAAKAHWGYSTNQLESWRSSLRVTAEQLVNQPAFVAETDRVVGFYTLRLHDDLCELDNLWVLPETMRHGYGRALLAHAVDTARSRRASVIHIDADPNALEFYSSCGAVLDRICAGSHRGGAKPSETTAETFYGWHRRMKGKDYNDKYVSWSCSRLKRRAAALWDRQAAALACCPRGLRLCAQRPSQRDTS